MSVTILSLLAVLGAFARPASVDDYTMIGKFVEQEAAPSVPAPMVFTDGDANCLQLSADGKSIDKIDTKTGKAVEINIFLEFFVFYQQYILKIQLLFHIIYNYNGYYP